MGVGKQLVSSSQSQGVVFSSNHVQMWELDHKEGWAPKNWRFWTVVLEKTSESPLDRKEIKPVNPKGNQSWVVIGRTDAEAEAPILQPPDVKSQFTGKDPDAGKDWRKEEKWTTEWDGWMASLTGWTEFEQAPGGGSGEGSLACCSPRGHKESDTTEQLNWTGWPEDPKASSTSLSIPSCRQRYRPWVSCLSYYQLTKQKYLFSFCRFFIFHVWYFLVVLE